MERLTLTKQAEISKKMADIETVQDSLLCNNSNNTLKLINMETKLQNLELQEEYNFYKKEHRFNKLFNAGITLFSFVSLIPLTVGNITEAFNRGVIAYGTDYLVRYRRYITGFGEKETKQNFKLCKQKLKDLNIKPMKKSYAFGEQFLTEYDYKVLDDKIKNDELTIKRLEQLKSLVTNIQSKKDLTSKEKALLSLVSKMEVYESGKIQLPKTDTEKVYHKVK